MAAHIDISELTTFFNALSNAAKGQFKKDMQRFLEAAGFDFLRVVQDEIIRLQVMDTRLLLHSFEKGGEGNVWEISDGGLTLQVGSSVNYAAWVEDGHFLNPQGVPVRFVPGEWQGDRFIYQQGASGGMLLRQKWVEGRHYFESALRIYERIFQQSAEQAVQRWLEQYFNF